MRSCIAHFAERSTPEEAFSVRKQAVLDPTRTEGEMNVTTDWSCESTSFDEFFAKKAVVSKVEALVGRNLPPPGVLVVFVILGGIYLWFASPRIARVVMRVIH
jgi:hypothetical protein